MKRLGLAALLLLACTPAREDTQDEARIARLEADVRALQDDNMRLRQRIIDLETVRATPMPVSSPVKAITARCKKSGEKFTISRAEAAEAAELNWHIELRIIPAFENGVSRGFKLFGIRPDSFVSSCGFQNGDTVTHVNGMTISSPDTALEAYAKLKTANRYEFAIERQGAKTYVTIDRK